MAKEQPQPPSDFDVLVFLKQHGKLLLFLVCLGLATGAAISWYLSRQGIEARNAAARLASARDANELQAVMATDTPSAPYAMLRLAKQYFDAADYATAMQTYAEFEQTYPGHSGATWAALGKLHCMEAMDMLEEARAGFDSFAAAHPDHYLTPQAILGKARCLERQDRPDEARVVYEDFVVKYPESLWRYKAEDSLQKLEKAKQENAPAPVKPAAS